MSSQLVQGLTHSQSYCGRVRLEPKPPISWPSSISNFPVLVASLNSSIWKKDKKGIEEERGQTENKEQARHTHKTKHIVIMLKCRKSNQAT